jgi:gliding motility-associated-like protein
MESDAVYDDNCDPNPITNFTEIQEEGVCQDDGYYLKRTLTWYAEDNCGNFTEITITVFITDTTPPVIDLPADLTVDCNSIPPVPVLTVTDNCDDNVQMDFEEVILGDTCEIYKIVRSWLFYDECLNAAWAQQKIVVMVDNLVLEDGPDDITIECDEAKPAFPILIATNMCSPPTVDTMTLTLPYDEATCSQKCIRVWTATDECGHEETTTQLITIVDTTAPEIEFNHPALDGLMDGDSVTYDCTEAIPFGPNDVTATDNCNEVNVEFMEMETFGDCDVDGYFVRLECCWKADDGCGNMSQICIIVRIADDQKPILVGIPEDITINQAFEDVSVPADVTATDLCDNDVTIEFVESQIANPDGCGYVLTRTWIATDDCGNSCSDAQIITVEDVCDCPNILVNATNIQNAECGQTNGSISVDMSIDPSLYQYLLLPNLGTQSPSGNEYTDLAPGTYILIINLPDFPDCDEKIYFNIEEEDCIDFLTVTIQGEEEVCLTTNELDYDGVITSATIFQAGNAVTVECTNIDGECVTLTPATGYLGTSPDEIGVVHCYNNNPNQCDTTYIIVIVEVAPFVCNIAIANENVTQPTCQGALGSAEITVSGMEGNLTYTWSPNVSTSNVASDLAGGDYGVTITDDATDCVIETTVAIENIEAATLTANDITTTNITCFGENNGSVISNINIEYAVINANGAMGVTPILNLEPGIYTISNTTANCSASVQIEITQPDELKVDFTATPESCLENDGTLTLAIQGGIGAMTYTWNPAVSTSATATGLTASQIYSVTVVDATGCQVVLGNLAITNDCQPCDLQLTVDSQLDETCMNADGEISLSAANQNGIVSYVWTPSVSTTNAAFGLSEGIYEILATDEFGCTASASVTINRTMPTWSATAESTPTTCGNDNGIATLNVANDPSDLTYTWSPNVSTTATAENLASGTYTVTLVDANGCQMTTEVEVENTPIDWSVEAIAVNTNCGTAEGSIMITNTGTGVYIYAWQPNVSTDNQAANLVVGLYQITVTDENGCEQIVNAEVLQNDVQFTAIPTMQNATCAGNDGAISIEVIGAGDYTYTWSDNISTSNEATNLIPNTPYSVTVTDENGCVIELNNMAVGTDCDPSAPMIETVIDTVECGTNSIDLCINLSELTGDLQGVTVCQQPTNGALSFLSDTCFSYSPIPDFAGLDTICFVACDVNNVCDTTLFEITVEACNVPCEDFVPNEEALAQTADCGGVAGVCIEVPLSNALNYGITDNDVAYAGDLNGCLNDTTFTYPSVIIPDGGNNGPYEFTWVLNGATVSGTFNNVAELVSFMNNNDPTGIWNLNPSTLNIGGGNPAFTYGMIEVTQTATGGNANLEPSTDLLPNGTTLWLTVGTHQVIFTDDNACTDTLMVEVFCIESETVIQNVLLNNDSTYCFDDAQVPGTASALEVTCDNCDNLDYTIDGNCVNYTGLELGSSDFLLVICDDNDLCDTVFLTVNIISSGLLPDANIDGDTTQINEAVTIPVIANDEINGIFVSFNITEDPANGSVIIDGDNVVYSPNLEYCGFDAFTYEICNENGCDIATVNLLIECTEPVPISGFSPNGDDINDGFMIQNLEMFPENELLIYDRWGNRVFRDLNYSKNGLWEGEYRNLIVPDGTYFYMFKYNKGEMKRGFVQIQR